MVPDQNQTDRADPDGPGGSRPDWVKPEVWRNVQQDSPTHRQQRNQTDQANLNAGDTSPNRPRTDRVAELVAGEWEQSLDRTMYDNFIALFEAVGRDPDPPVTDAEIGEFVFKNIVGLDDQFALERLPDLREERGWERHPSGRTDKVTDAYEAM